MHSRGKYLSFVGIVGGLLLASIFTSILARSHNETESSPSLSESVLENLKSVQASQVISTLVLAVVGFYGYDVFFNPMIDLAQNHPVPSKGIEAINRSRLHGMPPCYPNGWYKILDSFELKRGEVKAVNVLGNRLVAFRGQDGKVGVLDAYCPHLGADLTIGGLVKGNCIECPFHGWKFDAEGNCTSIPYADTIPEVAHTTTWLCKEVNHMIFIYFHSDGSTKSEPIYPCPDYPEMMQKNWVYHGKTSHYVSAHIQELPENGADVAHLHHLHIPFLLQFFTFISHRWEASWNPGEGEESHVGKIRLSHWLQFFGRDIPGTQVDTIIDQVGPGVIFLTFLFPFGKAVIIGSVTPQAPLLQLYDHVVYAERHMPRFFAKIVLWSLATQLNRDIPIWNSKAFFSKPLVVKNDGKIPQFRRWFTQFYTKNEDGTYKRPEGLDW